MTTQIHISADTDCWTGASTTALLAARCAADAVVVCGLPDELMSRFTDAGIKTVRCKPTGMFGALNLSRALRRIEGSEFTVYLHSAELRPVVGRALPLVGRRETITLAPEQPEVLFPPVEVEHPAADAEPLIMWLGNITESCSLGELIDYLGSHADRPWRLRVVGQGKARVAVPLLNRCKSLRIADRIEWIGYAADPYRCMNGVSLGFAPEGSVAAREFAAASIPVISTTSDIKL